MADGVDSLMYEFGAGKSAIRTVFEETMALKEQGITDIWDFSIGNPQIPAPPQVREAIIESLDSYDQLDLHGYSPNKGWETTCRAVADSLNRKFGEDATADDIVMTGGAAGAITCSIGALTMAGEEVIVITPYYAEYRMFIQTWHCRCIEVPSQDRTFQLDLDAIEAAITPSTRMIILNTPCNPTGAIYTEDSIAQLAELLRKKGRQYNRTIYLLSDEPYREICYEGAKNPWIAGFYENTVVCYSFSKSLSLAGERVGYVYLPKRIRNHDYVMAGLLGAQRAVNSICNSLFQRVIERCVDIPAPVEEYERKRSIIYNGLTKIGYEMVQPQGAFYLWIRCLEPDDHEFTEHAKKFSLYLVESTDFGCPGYCRLSYSFADEMLETSLPQFQKLWDDYGGYTW